MAVGEALGNYLKKTQNRQNNRRKSYIGRYCRHAAPNPVKWYNANHHYRVEVYRNLPIAPTKDPWKCNIFGQGTRQVERQNKACSRQFRPFFLCGKILNVEKTIQHKVLESEEIRNIYTRFGCDNRNWGWLKALNITKLRYHKIIIMTDADVDGATLPIWLWLSFSAHERADRTGIFVYRHSSLYL